MPPCLMRGMDKAMPTFLHDRHLIGDVLVFRKLITVTQLAHALSVQRSEKGVFIGEILMRLGYAGEMDIVTALVVQYNLPYIAVMRYQVEPCILGLIPSDLARRKRLVPLDRIGNVLSVVVPHPPDAALRREVEALTHCRMATFISTRSEIDLAIEHFYPEPDQGGIK